jgi:hypothetical protein
VPQSHLAPELRSVPQPAATGTPGGHARQASDALSKYQASRQAAQAQQGLGPDAVHPAGNGAVRRGDNGGRQ